MHAYAGASEVHEVKSRACIGMLGNRFCKCSVLLGCVTFCQQKLQGCSESELVKYALALFPEPAVVTRHQGLQLTPA